MRVIVALEPRSHRDTLRDAIARLRPGTDPIAVAPGELARRPGRVAGALVLLGEPVEAVQERAFAWLVVAPQADQTSQASVAGCPRALAGLDLSGLLALIDECQVARRPPLARPGAALRGQLGRSGRALANAPLSWRYVHACLAVALVATFHALVCQGSAALLGPAESTMIMGALGGIAAIEARQYRRTHGAWARG